MRLKALKRRRESLGLTQDELAERLGVETDTLPAGRAATAGRRPKGCSGWRWTSSNCCVGWTSTR
jgi:transcriptional regulator with XRE-family HTH domain